MEQHGDLRVNPLCITGLKINEPRGPGAGRNFSSVFLKIRALVLGGALGFLF